MKDEMQGDQSVQLEISVEKLAYLFESGVICAAEIRCLTAHTKQQVSALCLRSCAKNIACNLMTKNKSSQTHSISLKINISQ